MASSALVKIAVRGKAEIAFWIRVLRLENDIEKLSAMVRELPWSADQKAFCPVIDEYDVGDLHFRVMLGLNIDCLGVSNGFGTIWLAMGEKYVEQATIERDKVGDELIRMSKARPFYKVLEVEPKEKDV